MVSIENTVLREQILVKLELSFGNFYLCEDVVVSEVFQGRLFGVDEAVEVIGTAVPFYIERGEFRKKVYVANRVHKYSVNPMGWMRLKDIGNYLGGYCVVDGSHNGMMNALLESKFVPINFKAATNLQEAFKWADKIEKPLAIY